MWLQLLMNISPQRKDDNEIISNIYYKVFNEMNKGLNDLIEQK